MSLKSNLLKAVGLGVVVTAISAGAAWAAVATASVNVRSGPGTSYRVIDTLAPGDVVDINGRSNGFCRIDAGGWVSCAYLTAGGGYEPAPRYVPYPVYPSPSIGFSFGFGGYPHHHWSHHHHHH
jgi:uncharacterized protein YraI